MWCKSALYANSPWACCIKKDSQLKKQEGGKIKKEEGGTNEFVISVQRNSVKFPVAVSRIQQEILQRDRARVWDERWEDSLEENKEPNKKQHGKGSRHRGRREKTLNENKNLLKKVKEKWSSQTGENGTEVSKQIWKGRGEVENEINIIPYMRRKGKEVTYESIDEIIKMTQILG